MASWEESFLESSVLAVVCAYLLMHQAVDLNMEKEHAWKLSFGGGSWLATQNH